MLFKCLRSFKLNLKLLNNLNGMASNQTNDISTATASNYLLRQSKKQILPQKYDYFLVLDFEATCDDSTQLNPQVNLKSITKNLFEFKLSK